MAIPERRRVDTKVETCGMPEGRQGVVEKFDRWAGEGYPYIVRFDDGQSMAYARHELKLVGDSLKDVRDAKAEPVDKAQMVEKINEILEAHRVISGIANGSSEVVIYCLSCAYITEEKHEATLVAEYVQNALGLTL
jgi:hypothetical protein